MKRESIILNTPVISEDVPLVSKKAHQRYSYRGNVFLIGNDLDFVKTLTRFIEGLGHTVLTCDSPEGILSCSRQIDCDVFLLDLSIAQRSNISFVSFIRQKFPYSRLILIFEIHQLDLALEGVKQGAYFYIPKSCNPSDIAELVHKTILDKYKERVYESSFESVLFEELAGNNPQMRRVVEIIRKVAPTDSTVLIIGESGVGKEVVAQILHRLSPRKDKPFIAINCAALPETLLESELFGHVQGAFTGAERDKRGLFAEADGGTIFLDEIGDMSLSTQAKLLRVLQNGEIRPVGSNTIQKVNVRIISATNKDLLKAVEEKTFREDLYYRLNVVQIRVPPLRDRKEALPALIQHFISRYNHRFGKNIQGVEDSAMSVLRAYHYPGNVRELESIIAHAVIMADDNYITRKDLPEYVLEHQTNLLALPSEESDGILSLAELEARHIRKMLEKFNFNQSETAKALGISRSTLWRKIKQYNIVLPNT